MFHVQCKECGAWTVVAGGPCTCDAQHTGQMCSGQFHEALDATGQCHCCPVEHNHRLATIESGTPCRPIAITVMGAMPLVSAG